MNDADLGKLESSLKELLSETEMKLTASRKPNLKSILKNTVISRAAHQQYYDDRTFGKRAADRVALFGGSWTFIFIFGAILLGWVVLN